MIDSNSSCCWRVYKSSVRGASHERANKPNQDAEATESCESTGIAIAAVADGHGSRKSFRSDRGAQIAAKTVVEQLRSYSDLTYADACNDAEVELPQRIVRNWQTQVDADLENDPINETERAQLSDAERADLIAHPHIAYGTTVVAALLKPEYGVYLQLGDGDILILEDVKDEPTRPLPADDRSFLNETLSFASHKPTTSIRRPGGVSGPWADFRVRVLPIKDNPPALILITTDGYPNAFVNDAGFRKAANDFLTLGLTEGWPYVKDQLSGWLEQASRQGSGDDVTVVLLTREYLEHSCDSVLPGTNRSREQTTEQPAELPWVGSAADQTPSSEQS